MNDTPQRKLKLQRVKKFVGSAVDLGIVIDGFERVRIRNGEETTISISTDEHSLCMQNNVSMGTYNSTTYTIPAGTDDVFCLIQPVPFKNDWVITLKII